MDVSPEDTCILDWNEDQVHVWLSNLGYWQYENQIREHKITGEVLCMLDPEGLKALGISSVGQRLSILKSVYLLKLAQNIRIDPDYYVPPSATKERQQQHVALEDLHEIVAEQGRRLRSLERENRALKEILQSHRAAFNRLRSRLDDLDDINPPARQTSLKEHHYVFKPTKPPFESDMRQTHSRSLSQPIGGEFSHTSNTPISSPSASDSSGSPTLADIQPLSIPPKHQVNFENLKRFKVNLDDPTSKLLPAALKKYRINAENWPNYAMYICYGSTGDRKERCLGDDEKPLILFQKLRDARKNPVCMLKQIRKPPRIWNRPERLPLRSPVMAASENTEK